MADCPWCGEFMYEGRAIDRFDTCGARECEREARYANIAEREEAQYRAEEDDWGRYR